MTSSGTGLPDSGIEKTKNKLHRLQPPYRDSHIYFGIFLQNKDGTEGEILGDGGVHKINGTDTGWPEFGYKLKKEYWNQGYITEFAEAFMEYWWNLPRKEVEIQVPYSSMSQQGTLYHPELVCAWTKVGNDVSEKVLKKLGFESIQDMDNPELHYWRLRKDLYEARSRNY
jgi:RimJ/RimL family protein N-acetyltransferase